MRGRNDYDSARLQGRLWTPDVDRASLAGWWSAKRIETLGLDGSGNVSTAADLSGKGRTFSQATSGSRLVWDRTGILGQPAFTSDGSRNMSASMSVTGTYLSIYFVGYLASTGGQQFARFISLGASGAADYNNSGYCNVQRNVQNAEMTFTRNSGEVRCLVSMDTPYVFACVDYGAGGSTGRPIYRDDDSTLYTVFNAQTGGTFNVSAIRVFNALDGSAAWAGGLGELILDTAYPSQDRIDRFTGYLAREWNMLGQRYKTRPYFNTPPLIGG